MRFQIDLHLFRSKLQDLCGSNCNHLPQCYLGISIVTDIKFLEVLFNYSKLTADLFLKQSFVESLWMKDAFINLGCCWVEERLEVFILSAWLWLSRQFTFYLRYHHGSGHGIIGGVTFFNESPLGSKVGIPSFETTTGIEYCGKITTEFRRKKQVSIWGSNLRLFLPPTF